MVRAKKKRDAKRDPVLASRRRVVRAGMAVLVILLLGTFGFEMTEGWAPTRALFFTLITLTTVGYSDYGLSAAGERLAIVVLMGGLATFTYALSNLVQGVVEYQQNWRFRMQHKIDAVGDHYIVCGLGRMGRIVCDRLADAGIPFVGLDTDPVAVERAVDRGYLALEGDATDDATLISCGIERAKGMVVGSTSDTDNIVVTLSARQLNPRLNILSRADDEHSLRKLEHAGASRVVSPMRNGAYEVIDTILKPTLAAFLGSSFIGGGGVELSEVVVGEASELEGGTIGDCHDRHAEVIVIALREAKGLAHFRPSWDMVLNPGDVLIIAADPEAIERFSNEVAGKRQAA